MLIVADFRRISDYLVVFLYCLLKFRNSGQFVYLHSQLKIFAVHVHVTSLFISEQRKTASETMNKEYFETKITIYLKIYFGTISKQKFLIYINLLPRKSP